jgi:hypothetical protein
MNSALGIIGGSIDLKTGKITPITGEGGMTTRELAMAIMNADLRASHAGVRIVEGENGRPKAILTDDGETRGRRDQ